MVVSLTKQALRLVTSDGETVVDSDELQGLWTEEQYLRITDSTNRLLEFSAGAIEVLPMPSDKHQNILIFMLLVLRSFVAPRGGKVSVAALRLRISPDKFREPDLLLLLDAGDPRRQNDYWLGADLVVEIVSPDNPDRDLVVKRKEYAEAGIPEYWIINPLDETITVLTLSDDSYVEHGVFLRGANATSVLLAGFSVDVIAVLDAD